jgi:hypothetical protein
VILKEAVHTSEELLGTSVSGGRRPRKTEGFLKGMMCDLCMYTYLTAFRKCKVRQMPEHIRRQDFFMAAIPHLRTELTVMILVCWCHHRKAKDLFSMPKEVWALFQMQFSYTNLGRKREIITVKLTVKIMTVAF